MIYFYAVKLAMKKKYMEALKRIMHDLKRRDRFDIFIFRHITPIVYISRLLFLAIIPKEDSSLGKQHLSGSRHSIATLSMQRICS